MLHFLFNRYPVYNPFGKDLTVSQLEAQYINYATEYPIDGDAMAISMKEFKK